MTDLNKKYAELIAWARLTGSQGYYIQDQVNKAEKLNLPSGVVYIRDDKAVMIDTCKNSEFKLSVVKMAAVIRGSEAVEVDAMRQLNADKLKAADPTKLGGITNQLGQVVRFYEHPTQGEDHPVLGEIDGVWFNTGFYDLDDFGIGSDYNPCLVNGQVIAHFQIK